MTERVPLLEGRALSKRFVAKRSLSGKPLSEVHALTDVDVALYPGETLGLVGESGCGKSTLGRVLLRLHEPTAGRLFHRGREFTAAGRGELRALRRHLQIVFQDPYGSLDPRMTVRALVAEPLRIHGLVTSKGEERDRVAALLERVGLRPDAMDRHPHEFSGGQRQRVGIARALALDPEVIVADEPISALDVSIQAQVLNLLRDLQEELGLSFLFIAHDLDAVEFLSHRVAVMYLGRIVEVLPRGALADRARHPYTVALRRSAPVPDPTRPKTRLVLAGEVPSPLAPPTGCAFHPRCPVALAGVCDREVPVLKDVDEGHRVACHRIEPGAPPGAFTVDPSAASR
ncbi:MAG: oligopeptide/dipeptide ABC transporter ATP-binding protein [Polyangiales bacterium]